MSFATRADTYVARIEGVLDRILPAATVAPRRLHEAMRYSALGGGKRIRPLLVYAGGEALGVAPDVLDAPAAAIELMHAFSLIHDDLPAMDNDDLRRGRPTAHKAFDEATAILAADAMQPLAFELLATHPALVGNPAAQVRLVALIADACGSRGMTGGQSMDLAAEGRRLDLVFIDADKPNYSHYWDHAHTLLRTGGTVIADNTMFQGFVPASVTDDHVRQRFAHYPPEAQAEVVKATHGVRAFNKRVNDDKRFAISLIPVGDGMTFGVKL